MACENCDGCVPATAPENVPYIVHETEMARAERHTKRIWIALIVSVLLLFASNAAWIYAWMQYDYVSCEAVTSDGGDANIIGNDGDIYNGYSENAEAHEAEEEG